MGDLREHIAAKLTDITWCTVGQAASDITRECHAGYWLEATDNSDVFIDGRRREVIAYLQRITSALGLTLTPTDTHASIAAIAGLKSMGEPK